FQVHRCATLDVLLREIPRGAGVVLLPEHLFDVEDLARLKQSVADAPPWSDLPLIVISGSSESAKLDGAPQGPLLSALGNVTFLERPLRAQTLIFAIRAALRARRRQYEVRELLLRQQKAVERVDLLADVASDLLLSNRPEEIAAGVFSRIGAHLGLEMYTC